MNKSYLDRYNHWLNSKYIEKEDKERLLSLKQNEKELEDSFYTELSFGTAGMRGVMGIGSNRLNMYTIRKATQGVANYILKNRTTEKNGVAIAYDCRIGSEEFAKVAALVLAGNGIKAYLFSTLHSTPELSFAVRELNCIAGIVITASHNPKEYNGYKVYWGDGAQIIEPQATGIIQEVERIVDFSEINSISEVEAIKKGLLEYIPVDMDTKFIEAVKRQRVNIDITNKESFKIVYTPLHGTGGRPVKRVFQECGFNSIYIVEQQVEPDGEFPTCSYANPEEPSVFKLSIELAEKVGANLCMANDPDADRIGVAIKDKKGIWQYPNGNQIGLVLLNYLLENKKDIPKNSAVISTIVSTPMLETICSDKDIKLFRTLTGFKYIGEKIKQFEDKILDFNFLLGFEESYGYLIGTHARDKDAIVATLLIAEMAAFYESKGSSILKELDKLYQKYGYYKEGILSITKQGKEGIIEIEKLMSYLKEIDGTLLNRKIISKIDYNLGYNGLPSSNVVQFILEDGSYITARPSGTEPKIKYYFGVNDKTEILADNKLNEIMEEFRHFIGNI